MLEAWCLWIWVPLAHPVLNLTFSVEGAAVSWPMAYEAVAAASRPAVLCKVSFLLLRGEISKKLLIIFCLWSVLLRQSSNTDFNSHAGKGTDSLL